MRAALATALGFALTVGIATMAAAADDVRLVEAAKQNDPFVIRALLDEGLDVNSRHPDGSTALLWATYYDDPDTAELLIAASADVNAANDYGESPLSLASQNRNAGLVDTLLAAGADPHAVKPTGETILMIAARAGNPEVVRALLAHDPDVNAAEPSKHQTALMWAAAHEHDAVVAALIAAGADVNAASTGGSTALHFAVQQGDVTTARLLLEAGADVHAEMTVRQIDQFTLGLVETLDGMTPLWLAITNCRQDGLEYFGSTEPHPVSLSCPANEELGVLFLENGADPNAPDGSGFPPLHRAVQTDMKHLVNALLSHGADPNVRVASDVWQWTGKNRGGARNISPVPIGASPYFMAAWTHNPELMQVLLDAGADPHAAADDDTTPLMAAASVGGRPPQGFSRHLDTPKMVEAVQVALDQGADINAANNEGRTAMHGAASLKSKKLIQFLADNGAKVAVTDNAGETPLSLARETTRLYEDADESVPALLRRLADAGP